MNSLAAVILAAGKGTRMKSALPKVLQQCNGRPMIGHVLHQLAKVNPCQSIIVTGFGGDLVEQQLGMAYTYVRQEPQLGSGHAVQQAVPALLPEAAAVMILCGDTPLLTEDTLHELHSLYQSENLAGVVLVDYKADPANYGRIILDDEGYIKCIVEEKDASAAEKTIKMINGGTYCFNAELLKAEIRNLKNDNAQGEYYLTDVVRSLYLAGHKIKAMQVKDGSELNGVNDLAQLAQAAKVLRTRKNNQLMAAGVCLIDPDQTYIENSVHVGADTIIEPGTHLRGLTTIGSNCYIGPGCDLKDCQVGAGSNLVRCQIVESSVGQNCNIGPFAYIRPGTVLADNVKVGDFVELKNSQVAEGSKIPHLSYIGDSTVGSKVNIGCGTITCNYDGVMKYRTVIEDGAFIGSNSNLVAPVVIGKGSYVGAGSTITADVATDHLAFERGQTKAIGGWPSNFKAKKTLEKQQKS